ncbi:protein phosphatase 2C domain-containing protein, partial [Streptomyces sp. NPDC054956]
MEGPGAVPVGAAGRGTGDRDAGDPGTAQGVAAGPGAGPGAVAGAGTGVGGAAAPGAGSGGGGLARGAVTYLGDRPPTYAAEPVALPAADPGGLDALTPDTVLEGAQYGGYTLRAASLRGDSARFRGEARRDFLLTARFGSGPDALVLVVLAGGDRAAPGTAQAAAEVCRSIAAAVGRSQARLADDIRAGRREALRSGLQRLTDRAYGRLRARAAELGLAEEAYTAGLRALLLPVDPECRTRVCFGAGPGGLLRLRAGQWQDLEQTAPPVSPGSAGSTSAHARSPRAGSAHAASAHAGSAGAAPAGPAHAASGGAVPAGSAAAGPAGAASAPAAPAGAASDQAASSGSAPGGYASAGAAPGHGSSAGAPPAGAAPAGSASAHAAPAESAPGGATPAGSAPAHGAAPGAVFDWAASAGA